MSCECEHKWKVVQVCASWTGNPSDMGLAPPETPITLCRECELCGVYEEIQEGPLCESQ